jgi:hypothetical protein
MRRISAIRNTGRAMQLGQRQEISSQLTLVDRIKNVLVDRGEKQCCIE